MLITGSSLGLMGCAVQGSYWPPGKHVPRVVGGTLFTTTELYFVSCWWFHMGTEQTSCCHVKSNTLISKQFENLCGYEKSWNWIPLPEDKDGLEKISGFANWLVNWHLRSILKKKECQEKLSHLRNSDRKKTHLFFKNKRNIIGEKTVFS